jgi:hypothetical protein
MVDGSALRLLERPCGCWKGPCPFLCKASTRGLVQRVHPLVGRAEGVPDESGVETSTAAPMASTRVVARPCGPVVVP